MTKAKKNGKKRKARHGSLTGLVPALRLTVLDGQYELTVQRLRVEEERLRVEYRITPPLPEELSPPIFPSLEGVDDEGREYLDNGGAYGTEPEGRFTDGSLSLTPCPPPTARSLTARLTVMHGDETSTHEVELPLADRGDDR